MLRNELTVKVKVYEGESILDGKTTILAILNTKVNNSKLGELFHTITIVPKGIGSYDELLDNDESICGACPFRRNTEGKRFCYVPVYYLWNVVNWSHQELPILDLRDKAEVAYFKKHHNCGTFNLRNGNYGDSASLPSWVRKALYELYNGNYIDYTHSPYKHGDSSLGLASCSSLEDKNKLNAAGWRTARVIASERHKVADEIICPNQRDKRITCSSCGLCKVNRKENIAFLPHGTGKKYFNQGLETHIEGQPSE